MARVSSGKGLVIVAELALPKLNVFEGRITAGFVVNPISPQKKAFSRPRPIELPSNNTRYSSFL